MELHAWTLNVKYTKELMKGHEGTSQLTMDVIVFRGSPPAAVSCDCDCDYDWHTGPSIRQPTQDPVKVTNADRHWGLFGIRSLTTVT
jgi:hypothetical protein